MGMSWFLGLLKHICCFGDEEWKEIPRNQSQSGHDYHRIPNIGYGAPSLKQSSPARSSNIHSNQYENSSRSLPNLDSHDPPSVTTKPILPSISKKSNEYAWQPQGAHLSSSNCSVPQSDVPNRATNKLTGENCFGDEERKGILRNQSQSDRDYHRIANIGYGTSSVKQSSLVQSSNIHSNQYENSSRSLHYSDSHYPPSVTTKPILPSISKKSNEYARQPKGAHLSSSNCSVPQIDIFSSLEKDPLPFSPSPSKSHSTKPPPISTKPTLSQAPSSSLSQQKKTNYVWVQKSASSTYVFPDDIKSSIEKEIIPGVLKKPLCMSTYKDYFHSLLYAEDCYLEKWDGFEMKNITLKLHEAEIYMRNGKRKNFNEVDEKEEKIFVAFEINKIPERPPFLLSRDHVSVQPSSRKIKAFQGVIYRVVKSNLVLIEFGEDFHSQHHPACEYDVKFSFNRVCLKRAHLAIASASDLLFRNFLFPGIAPTPDHEFPSTQRFPNYRYQKDAFAVHQILRLQGSPPYLVEGPISVVERKHLSKTGVVIVEAALRICQYSPSNRVLLCAPQNNTCDVLMRALKKEMGESDMFRANAAFREIDGVPVDILPSCHYEEEMDCFACPSLEELKKYKVISSTFMSSFRLRDEGMMAGHFSHIFLVDASSATEPETMVPLANFANSKTIVVVTGTPRNHSGWVRSKIARQNGLRTSYFERLGQSELYKNLDPRVITQLEDP